MTPAPTTARLARPLIALLATALLLMVSVVASILFGARVDNAAHMWALLTGNGTQQMADIVDARWARTVVGACVGAALAVSGQMIQGLTRNPLGEPGLLGITSGASASLVTVTAIVGSTIGAAQVWATLPGALLAVVTVYVLARPAHTESVVPLVLCGAVVSAVLYAYVQGMILRLPEVFDSYRFWVVGSLAGADLSVLPTVAPVLIPGLILAVLVCPGLNMLALGDDAATALGTPVARIRMGGLAAATLLAAGATAAAGPIAFAGLAVPHLVRAMVGADHRWQLPLNLLLGASLLVAADLVGRVIVRPNELMVGVVTAFLGAPFLLLAVRRGAVTER